jgi:hypothetical protein
MTRGAGHECGRREHYPNWGQMIPTTLVLPPRYTPDTIAVGRAAGSAGWDVERLASWRVPAWLTERAVPRPAERGPEMIQ